MNGNARYMHMCEINRPCCILCLYPQDVVSCVVSCAYMLYLVLLYLVHICLRSMAVVVSCAYMHILGLGLGLDQWPLLYLVLICTSFRSIATRGVTFCVWGLGVRG
jgi:hypothetical protein